MLPSDKVANIFESVRRGRYNLLLGAGFSASSIGPDGKPLPVGNALRDEIGDKFLAGTRSYTLAATCGAVNRASLSAYLTARFSGCVANEQTSVVRRFVWKSIYTFNIDDVLVSAYKKPNALQKPRFATFKNSPYSSRDVFELPVVHLHGSVLHPDHGYIFSPSEYGGATASDSSWFKLAADDLADQPFIILGCNHFQEQDLEHYLARRQGFVAIEAQTAPSIYVTRDVDPVKSAFAAQRGLILVKASSDEFLAYLDEQAGKRPSAIELAVPNDPASIFNTPPKEESQRLFFGQWQLVRSAELQAPEVQPLMVGVEPTWTHIASGQDVIRGIVNAISQDIDTWLAASTRIPELTVISGSPGDGKSTALRRVAYNLAQSGRIVFFLKVRERILVDSVRDIVEHLKSPPVFVVDSTAEHGHQIQAMLESLSAANLAAFVITAERLQRLHKVDNAISYERVVRRLSHLSIGEAHQLVERLRQSSLLGFSAGESDTDLAQRVVGQSWFAATVLLNKSLPSIQKVIQAELAECDETSRRIYAVVSLAHSCGYPVRMSVIERAAGVSLADLDTRLKTELRGLIVGLPPHGDLRQTRHRVLAEAVSGALNESQKFLAFESLATALAPYVSRLTVRAGTDEARLAARLLDVDHLMLKQLDVQAAELFFDRVRPAWEWNSRYWEQRALLRLPRDPTAALQFAETAVGIERHPVPLTTLAKVEFRLAAADGVAPTGIVRLRNAVEHGLAAIELSNSWRRVDIHAYDVTVRGVVEFVERLKPHLRSKVPADIIDIIDDLIAKARKTFRQEQQSTLVKAWAEIRKTLS